LALRAEPPLPLYSQGARLMSSAVFDTIRLLEKAELHFFIERTRPDSIRLSVTMVGERAEIDIFEDNHLEISRFRGDESVVGGMEVLLKLLKSA
jgi:hypothetical protein